MFSIVMLQYNINILYTYFFYKNDFFNSENNLKEKSSNLIYPFKYFNNFHSTINQAMIMLQWQRYNI